MNQKLLGVLRAVGLIALFSALTAVIHAIPGLSGLSPEISGVIVMALAAAEHQLADYLGYNLPVGMAKVSAARLAGMQANTSRPQD